MLLQTEGVAYKPVWETFRLNFNVTLCMERTPLLAVRCYELLEEIPEAVLYSKDGVQYTWYIMER